MSRQRLWFLNRYYYPDHSATSQMLTDLTLALDPSRYDVAVVCSRQRYDDAEARLRPTDTVEGVAIHRVWTTRFGRASLPGRALDYVSFYGSVIVFLLRRVGRNDIVIVKTDPPLLNVIAALCARIKRYRIINWVQDLFPEVAARLGMIGAGSAPFRFLRWLRDRGFARSAHTVAIGEKMRELIRSRGIAAERISVIPNWADGDAIKPVARADNALRRDWQLGERFVVGYSGNLGRAHDFRALFAAAESLRDNDDVAFLIIGGGAQLPELEREASERGLTNVMFKPYQPRERLAESLSASDVHFASLQEQLEGCIVPSKVYGILAAGRPVLFEGSLDGEVAGLVARHDVGACVAAGDAEAMVREIRALAADRDNYTARANRARAVFDAHFSLHAATERWHQLLGTVR